ncbi:MAG: hypothetical protein NZ765_12640 [Anaerolineae bacterium]|nr:hypothetical protein [Anaerolineae bacterium]MDW8072441.1 hypothetical protein [Anaerolineae bacterium]
MVSLLLAIVAVGCLLLMFLLLNVASRSISEARSSIFPIVREEGWARARRARLGAAIAALIAVGTASGFFSYAQPVLPELSIDLSQEVAWLAEALTIRAPAMQATPSETSPPEGEAYPDAPVPTPIQPVSVAMAVSTLTPTPTPSVPTIVHSPTPTASPTATPEPPTLTPTSTATSTPAPSVTPTPSPARSPVPPLPDAMLGPITFAAEIDDRRNPIHPTQVFSNTVKRIYAVFPFRGMRRGVPWTQVWYFNGLEFLREEGIWEWGSQDRSYIFIKPVGAGTYRLELYVSTQLMASGEFTVLGPAAVGGPYNP